MKTFEQILEDMLARIPGDLDKREGSIIYNALAPSAAELAQVYIALEGAYSNTFIATSSGTELDERAGDFGFIREQATKAVRTIEFKGANNAPFNVSIGTRFTTSEINSINYIVLEKIADGQFYAQSETPGTIGNEFTGAMLPLDYIAGLESSTMTSIVIPARDTETDFEFIKRIQSLMVAEAQDGNQAQYQKWASSFEGIGISKTFPLWNGANTVKVSILDELHKPASQLLISNFQNYLDPGKTGLGNGKAPIGAVVTVATATPVALNITGNVKLATGFSELIGVTEALNEWLYYLAYKKDTVNYFELVATVLAVPCIESVENLFINGATNNIVLNAENVAVLGDVGLVVVS